MTEAPDWVRCPKCNHTMLGPVVKCEKCGYEKQKPKGPPIELIREDGTVVE